MNNILNIVTPVSRYDFLEIIYYSIKNTMKSKWIWYLVLDKSKLIDLPKICWPECKILFSENSEFGHDGGSAGRNIAIDNIHSGWISFLDDDTIMHPNFYNTFSKVNNFYPYALGFTVITCFSNNIPRIIPYPYGENQLDTSCFVFKREAINDIRWHLSPRLNDVVFYNQVWENFAPYIIHMTDVAAYYNYLRPVNECMINE